MQSLHGRIVHSIQFLLVATGVLLGWSADAQAQLWKNFLPGGSKSEAEQPRPAQPPAAPAERFALNSHSTGSAGPQDMRFAGDLKLTENNGPWLIVAASFSGEGAEQQATNLATELRTQHRLAAYVHQMDFKFGESNPGQGLDNYGTPTRRRYSRGESAREIAVLVGDYQSIDDPNAQQILAYIKALEPQSLNVDPNKTAQSMAKVRKFEDALLDKFGKTRKRGPMAQAFLTRNPLLPREYFVPKGVDNFVAKMNQGVEHNLLDCPGAYSIKVATFRGKTILQTSAQQAETTKSFWGRKKNNDDNPLVEAAENAHLLTEELRSHGWEAYEFHDRTESIVTIGSFDEVTRQLPDGRVVVVPEVQKIVQTFDAGYDTPADPITGIGNDATTKRRVEQQQQQATLQLTDKQAQIVPGLNPKHVKIMAGRGKNREQKRIIPMDIHPEAISVPKRSLSSTYAG